MHSPNFTQQDPSLRVRDEIGQRRPEQDAADDFADQIGHLKQTAGYLAADVDAGQEDHRTVQVFVHDVNAELRMVLSAGIVVMTRRVRRCFRQRTVRVPSEGFQSRRRHGFGGLNL